MDDTRRQELFEHAKAWILEAGEKIRETIDEPLYVDIKSDPKDLVTQMDKNTEKYFVEKIVAVFPDHKLLSEEGFGHDVQSLEGTVWIVDPIDGTMNFVNQKRNFAISIGIYHDGIGEIGLIYNVMEDVLYTVQRGKGAYKNDKVIPRLEKEKKLEESIVGLNNYWACVNPKVNEKKIQDLVIKARGTRSYGSAALEFAYVAEGIIDAYLTMSLSPWDFAAGVILVNEVGGTTTTVTGDSLNMLENNSVLSCHPNIKREIINDYVEIK